MGERNNKERCTMFKISLMRVYPLEILRKSIAIPQFTVVLQINDATIAFWTLSIVLPLISITTFRRLVSVLVLTWSLLSIGPNR
jgi:hypothetical protein